MTGSFNRHFNLFLLDDSPEDRAVYKHRLSKMPGISFDITEADNLQNAKDKIKANSYDCYVIDYNLPQANGLDFIRYILKARENDEKPSAFVLVTGQGNENIAAEAFKLGVHEYLTKESISDGVFGRPVINAIEKAQLTAQIKNFREQLERSNKELSDFTHMAAHDLKSPLRRIQSYCEILREDAIERLNEEDVSILERMELNARRMRELVDSLLSYSQINTESEIKRDIELNVLLDQILQEYQPQIDKVKGLVEIKNTVVIKGYPVRIKQLLVNLISNALKYKKTDVPPHIIIDMQENDGCYNISVKDNGIGISPAGQKEIFKDFSRLHANEDIEGTGLGLSICKKIAKRHGGDIWVESAEGKGSTFYVTFPRN